MLCPGIARDTPPPEYLPIRGPTAFAPLNAAFEARYRRAALRRTVEHAWRAHAALLLPGTATVYTVEQMLAEPVWFQRRPRAAGGDR